MGPRNTAGDPLPDTALLSLRNCARPPVSLPTLNPLAIAASGSKVSITMKRSRTILLSLFSLLFSMPSFASIPAPIPIRVNDGQVKLMGELWLPTNNAANPALVVIVHEWWGLNDYPRSRAKQLNDAGYAALLVDLFGNGKSVATPPEAQALTGPFYKNGLLAVRRIQKFLKAVESRTDIDHSRIAAVGYCFGGSQVLNVARSGTLPQIRGVASFHGGLMPAATGPKATAALKSKTQVLVLHGEADPMVKSEDVTAFKLEMTAAGFPLHFVGYPGALHAFTNPKATEVGLKFKIPVAYHPEADQKSWAELLLFLKDVFTK